MGFKFYTQERRVAPGRGLSDQARREFMAASAIEMRDGILRRNAAIIGREPDYETFVDGVEGAALTDIKPGGVIAFRFYAGAEIFIQAVLILRANSPYDPTPDGQPHYRDRHFVIVDDVLIDPPYSEVVDFERAVIVNDRIYTRKLEQKYAVYEVAYAKIKQRFGRGGGAPYRIDFIYDDYFGERFPAILIRPR